MLIGDAVEKVANPIAKALDVHFGTNWQNCPACKQTKERLNSATNASEFAHAIFDRFFTSTKE